MKKLKSKLIMLLVMVVILCTTALAGCKDNNTIKNDGKTDEKSVMEIVGDYYIDLSDLGMKLVIYLRLSEDGRFQFSNTTDFEVNKSSGILKKGTNNYMMIYETVGGNDKSISDGLTSSFFVDETGQLDFSGCEKIYYGSASATTVSDETNAKLTASKIPENYKEPNAVSEFEAGTYTAEHEESHYTAVFYADNTYLLIKSNYENGSKKYFSETGIYGVNASQLALTPNGAARIACDIISDSQLELSIPTVADGNNRENLSFTKQTVKEQVVKLSGEGTVTGSDEKFEAAVSLYSDGSYVSRADGFVENGIFVPDSESGTFKIYPDNMETKIRGLNQVSTVPTGVLMIENGIIRLEDFRIRTSENLTRYKCILIEDRN